MENKVDQIIEKASIWKAEIQALRAILLSADVEEAVKWSRPAYHHKGKIIAVIQAFKSYFALLFYEGHLLQDPNNVLQKTGPNTVKGRQMRFSDVKDIKNQAAVIKSLMKEAIKLSTKKD